MSDSFRKATDGEAKARPVMRRYRSTATPLSRDQAERQGEVARLAFELLGRDAAMVFLNTPDAALGGRPIDLAIGSTEGAANVTRAIRAR